MGIQNKRLESKNPQVFLVQLLCILMMGVVEFLNMTDGCFPQIPVSVLMNVGIMLSLLGFWGITMLKTPRAFLRRDVIWGIVMALWFLVVEMNRRINYIPLQSLTIFLVIYLFALPFASVTQDQNHQIGIRLISGIYLGTAVLFMIFGLVLFAGGRLPGTLGGQVYWDGPRLFLIHHPNVTGRIFMIALALCMGFLGQIKNIYSKISMLLAALLLFAGIALTNCRAVILPSCCIVAGNVLFWICNKNRKGILLAVVTAMVVAAVAFWSSDCLYQWNRARLINQAAQQTTQEQSLMTEASGPNMQDSNAEATRQEEVPGDKAPEWNISGNGNSSQPPLIQSLPTMNGRTEIWTAFLKKILDEPEILLRGTVDTRLVLKNKHTHNAWLEALIMLGLPGFLLVLLFSWNATWASLRVLWRGSIGMFEKNIALLVLSMMIAALLEPCLFITYQEWSFFDFFFFLCLGYLTLWSKHQQCEHKS